MPRIRNMSTYIKNGTLFFEIKVRIRTFLAKDCEAKSRERSRMVYQKLCKDFNTKNDKIPEYQNIPKRNDTVWIYWGQGFDAAPELVKACFNSVKRNLKDKKIVALTDENVRDYIELPEYIVKKYKNGIISKAHYSDLVRIELLCKYGGLWLDSTVLCTSNNIPDFYFNSTLFMYKSMELNRQAPQYGRSSNWLISTHGDSKILAKTRNMLHAYWRRYNYTLDYFIFHLFIGISSCNYKEEWDKIPAYNNHSPHMMMFELGDKFSPERWAQLLEMSPFHKLERHTDYSGKKDSIYAHIIKEYDGKK